jgi:trehalose/maltose hydrolase-like predicted phosphorylase
MEIAHRPDVATAVNASFYAILSSVRDDWAYGLAPGGLTNYYNGHSFWDTETWMYPPLLYFHPTISKSLIQYRFNRIDGAKRKAQSYSPPWGGMMFPWESAFTGVETCPTFAATGLREDHISGDIALGIWQEYLMRRDVDWLRSTGYPMLEGIAGKYNCDLVE